MQLVLWSRGDPVLNKVNYCRISGKLLPVSGNDYPLPSDSAFHPTQRRREEPSLPDRTCNQSSPVNNPSCWSSPALAATSAPIHNLQLKLRPIHHSFLLKRAAPLPIGRVACCSPKWNSVRKWIRPACESPYIIIYSIIHTWSHNDKWIQRVLGLRR